LIERFKVSRTTVRKAIQNLIERGLEVRCGLWGETRPPAYSTSASWPPRKPSRTTLHWRLGHWWSGYGVFAWPTACQCLFDETYVPRDIGEKAAGNDLEAEPLFALLEDKNDTPLVEAGYSKRPRSTLLPLRRSKAGRQPDLSDRAHVFYHRQ
jgi:GntR family transcriptional regulator